MEATQAQADLRDGTYEIQVDSSSSMFRITHCELTVRRLHGAVMAGNRFRDPLYGEQEQGSERLRRKPIFLMRRQAEGANTFASL